MSSAGGLALRVLPGRGPLRRVLGSVGGRSSLFLVERHALVYRHTWLVFVSGVVEPLFYLLSIGVGLGHLVGSVYRSRRRRSATRPSWRPPCWPARR